MPRPRPPSKIEPIATPCFGMHWYADPATGESMIAYCGGGGAAATGVQNFFKVTQGGASLEVPTGNEVGVGIQIVQNPITGLRHVFVALGKELHRYSLPDGELTGKIECGDNLNCLNVNNMADQVVVGCENGTAIIYEMNDEELFPDPVYVLEGHEKAVCGVAFAPRLQDRVLTSAKDGTAKVWQNGECLASLVCDITDHNAPPPARTPQVLVRGCAFGDLDGQVVYTIASGRKGKAYLSHWEEIPPETDDPTQARRAYELVMRTECSPCPISAMSLSGDASLLAMGSVDGTIILWSIEKWKALKRFPEVHDLPVTCIASRPYAIPLQGDEEEGIEFHAVSASADSQLAFLTMQRRGPRKAGDGPSFSFLSTLKSVVKLIVLYYAFQPVAKEIQTKCTPEWNAKASQGYWPVLECIRDEGLWAPNAVSPPY